MMKTRETKAAWIPWGATLNPDAVIGVTVKTDSYDNSVEARSDLARMLRKVRCVYRGYRTLAVREGPALRDGAVDEKMREIFGFARVSMVKVGSASDRPVTEAVMGY